VRRILALVVLLLAQSAFAQSTLDAVRSRGFVQCGVNTGLAGFSQADSKGVWRGIDVDLCRAVAAAVFGDAAKVRFTPLTAQPLRETADYVKSEIVKWAKVVKETGAKVE